VGPFSALFTPKPGHFSTLFSLAAMVGAKERWRVSIKAQIRRLADLDIIPDDYAIHLYKLYSAKGWSREEPFDRLWEPASPRLLRDSLQVIVAGGVRSKTDLLALEFAISAGDVENLASLPPGWFARDPAPVVTLKPRNGETRVQAGGVVQFPSSKFR